ncbi:hypothetical protein C2G38_1135706 [Gigaspora rosea]|uniref:Uncharacterized protein n=1 Tax=Gigaspora rosea TaxID=44941 RepID=A0A397VJ92_9GLOM|nr:hypothetical protein C2G38_1135706 [Gigaspora rosea]
MIANLFLSKSKKENQYITQQSLSLCNHCGRKVIGFPTKFCRSQLFAKYGNKKWSGNKDIDAFIKKTKKESLSCDGFIEWIPISDIENINPLEQSGYSKIYSSIWKPFKSRNKVINKQKLPGLNVVLKGLKNSRDFNDKFLNEVTINVFRMNFHIINANF